MLSRRVLSMFLVLAFSLVGIAYAADVEVKSVAEAEIKVKNEKGEFETRRIDAAKANVGPGDEVIFSNYYVNNGDQPVTDVVILNPVPMHTIYVDGSAGGEFAKVEFSVDGGKTFGAPETLKVKDKNGRERIARAEDYTHIRWVITKPVAPKETGVVYFKAKIK
jgi:uncharacterized repeat protein (TIGR01451 family)